MLKRKGGGGESKARLVSQSNQRGGKGGLFDAFDFSYASHSGLFGSLLCTILDSSLQLCTSVDATAKPSQVSPGSKSRLKPVRPAHPRKRGPSVAQLHITAIIESSHKSAKGRMKRESIARVARGTSEYLEPFKALPPFPLRGDSKTSFILTLFVVFFWLRYRFS